MSSEEPCIREDNHDTAYGMPLRPSTPMKAVLGHFYGFIAAEEKHLAYSEKRRAHGRQRSAINPLDKKTPDAEPKGLFKMKKFLKIGPRTSTRRALSFSG